MRRDERPCGLRQRVSVTRAARGPRPTRRRAPAAPAAGSFTDDYARRFSCGPVFGIPVNRKERNPTRHAPPDALAGPINSYTCAVALRTSDLYLGFILAADVHGSGRVITQPPCRQRQCCTHTPQFSRPSKHQARSSRRCDTFTRPRSACLRSMGRWGMVSGEQRLQARAESAAACSPAVRSARCSQQAAAKKISRASRRGNRPLSSLSPRTCRQSSRAGGRTWRCPARRSG